MVQQPQFHANYKVTIQFLFTYTYDIIKINAVKEGMEGGSRTCS